jgi:hypothetical protein
MGINIPNQCSAQHKNAERSGLMTFGYRSALDTRFRGYGYDKKVELYSDRSGFES